VARHELERLVEVFVGSAASATTLIAMSRSVIIPTSSSSSVIGSEPMCPSRISCAASTTDVDASIERGLPVMVSRTFSAISSPLLVVLLDHYANRLTKSSAVWATSRQPWSIVREWPRFGTLTISVTAELRLCRL
jgi:hypothetical protein